MIIPIAIVVSGLLVSGSVLLAATRVAAALRREPLPAGVLEARRRPVIASQRVK